MSEQETEPQEPREIKDAKSFDELYDILYLKGKVVGDDGKTIEGQELWRFMQLITDTRLGFGNKEGFEFVPKNDGLHDKVIELHEKEMKEE